MTKSLKLFTRAMNAVFTQVNGVTEPGRRLLDSVYRYQAPVSDEFVCSLSPSTPRSAPQLDDCRSVYGLPTRPDNGCLRENPALG